MTINVKVGSWLGKPHGKLWKRIIHNLWKWQMANGKNSWGKQLNESDRRRTHFVDYKCRNVCYKFRVCLEWKETREHEETGEQRVGFPWKERGNETQPQLSRKQVAQLLMLHIFPSFYYFCAAFLIFRGGWLEVGAKAAPEWSMLQGLFRSDLTLMSIKLCAINQLMLPGSARQQPACQER